MLGSIGAETRKASTLLVVALVAAGGVALSAESQPPSYDSYPQQTGAQPAYPPSPSYPSAQPGYAQQPGYPQQPRTQLEGAFPSPPSGTSTGASTMLGRLSQVETELTSKVEALSEATRQEQQLGAQVTSLTERKASAEERVQARGRALYRMTRAGMLPLSGGFPSLLSHASRVERLQRLVRQDLEALETLNGRVSALRAEAARHGETRETLSRQIRELRSERDALAAERSRLEAFGSVFEDPPYSAAPTGPGYVTSSYGSVSTAFTSQRGRLPLPVAGAMRIHPSPDETSITFGVGPSASVRAISEGRIAYASPTADGTTMIVVDHGEGYFSLYRGLGRSNVVMGQWISGGASLGSVADPNGLYFEIRNRTRPVSAREWLGI